MLTEFAITRTKPEAGRELRLSDGEGLHLAILPNGRRFWRWDYTYLGRRKQLSFGKYPVVTLKRAREKRFAAQQLLDAGTDPSSARKEAKATAVADTFQAVAEEWIERDARILNPRTIAKKRALLDRYLLPALGKYPVAKILPAEVLQLLRAIERLSHNETAHRVRQIASEIFRYAVVTSRAQMDPAGLLGGALAPVHVRHHPTLLDPIAVGKLLTAIDEGEAAPVIMGALKLTPLVFVRSSELRNAQWAEIDLDRAMWRIPAARMKPTKARMDHLVPLSRQAIAILRDLKAVTGANPLVFPGLKQASRAISNATLPHVLRRCGYSPEQQSIHGFRTLASTHLREIGFDGDLVELQLSHQIASPVRAAYDQAARVPERIQMMQAWADHLDDMKAGRVKAFTGRRVLKIVPRARQRTAEA